MWKYQPKEENWIKKVEKLDKRVYNFLRQEIEDVRFYSKCLDGTTYLASQDLDDIYEVLQFKNNTSQKIDSNTSTKFVGNNNQPGNSISPADLTENGNYTRYKHEYGLTLKNLFSPNRLIKDSTNYNEVDVATTESLNLNVTNFRGLVIDGVTLLNGHRLLIKDNVTVVTIDANINPENFFTVNYYLIETTAGKSSYFFYNNENGIYTFEDGVLTKTSDLDDYQNNIRYSVNVKLGDTNGGKQFHISRMKNGYYPTSSNFDNVEFTEKTNYIIRNELDYRNVLDNQFYGGLIQQATTFNEFQVSERILSIGDFGVIINYQDDYPNILKNKYKEDLKDVKELNSDYLIVGDNGILLQLDKINLIPSKIDLNTFENLNSIDFIDQNRGVIVGEHGSVFVTSNRYDWSNLDIGVKSHLNKTLFTTLSNSYVVGNNGELSKLTLNLGENWTSEKIELNRKNNLIDNYRIVEDLSDVDSATLDIERFNFTGTDWVDLDKSIGDVDFSFDFRFKATSLIGFHTVFSFLTERFPVAFTGGETDLGVRVRIEDDNNSWKLVMYVNNVTDPTTLESITSDLTIQEDQWYHVMVTRKRGTYNFYVNQKLRGTITNGYEGSFNNFNSRIRLGAELTVTSLQGYSTTTFNQFRGTIDQVRLWNKSLDTKEISDFSNNYLENLSGLKNWYKFNVIKDPNKRIRTKDLIESEDLILPSSSNLTTYNTSGGTSMIDTESFSGIVVSGEDLMGFVLDVPTNYSLQNITNQIFVKTSFSNIKNIVYNSNDKYFYGVSDSLFRIDSEKFEFDLFNEINQINVEEEIVLNHTYNNLKLDIVNNKLVLIGGESNQIDELNVSDICQPEPIIALENCTPYITPVITGTNGNGLSIENNYRNSFTSSSTNEINFIKVEDIDVSTQSLVEIPITATSGAFLNYNTELYLSLEVSDLVNGSLEVSLDNNNYISLNENNTYLLKVFVGNDSTLRFRAQISDDPVGNKVKGKIKNIILYLPDCVQDTDPEIYTGTNPNIERLYFTQYDETSRIDTLTSSLYSYIDLKSFKINDVEQINFANYAASGLPAYLYDYQTPTQSLVNCDDNGFCYYNPSFDNTVVDRIKYGFDLVVSNGNYTYSTTSFGLIEAFTLNDVQSFGIDIENISNGFSIINNPVKMGFDFAKSFSFELDSFILFNEDLLNSDLTNGNATQSQQVTINSGGEIYGTPSGNYFNQLVFTASSTYSVNLDSTLNINQLYYIELETDGDITITLGTQSVSFTASNSPQNTQLRLTSTASSVGLTSSGGVTVSNFVVTDLLPKKNLIEWDPNTCDLSYTINGQDQIDDKFLLSNGSGSYSPPCEFVSNCDNTQFVNSLVNQTYWNKFDSKLLFLDYDIASKLYFFDTNTGEYQLPSSVNISNINIFELKSISGEQSWMDYSKDVTKEFEYETAKTESNSIKYSTIFNLSSGTHSVSFTPNGISTNNINNINGTSSGTGLFPSILNGTFSVSFGTPPSATHSLYLQNKYLVLRTDNTFEVSQGDVFRLESGLITTNMMVNKILENSGNYYIYFIPQFNQSIRNSLVKWTKTVTFTNLNYFDTETELIDNFNLHPISIGYKLLLNSDETIAIDPQFNQKTAYYNLQYQADVTDIILNKTSQTGVYINKFLSFGYTPTYNILDYLTSVNSDIDGTLILSSLPEYSFSNSNSGVIYTLSTGIISFNSKFKTEWESIPKYTFVDLTFGSITLESILIINKGYDSSADRYTLQTYNYLEHLYDQSSFNSSQIRIRVRNLLSEVSSDLQKINNIQRSSSTAYHITDLDNEVFTSYTNLKSELNFKPNTDSYVKALLSRGEIKENLTGIVYTDYKNELAINMVNLSEERNLTVSSIDRFYSDCDGCTYSDYQLFTNPSNNLEFNQYSLLNATTYYTNRDPIVSGFENQIRFVNATGSGTVNFTIDSYATASTPTTKVLEFEIESLTNGNVVVSKGGATISTFASITSEVKDKVTFTDDGVQNLTLTINYTVDGDNDIRVNDIRVGENELCADNCYLTQLTISDHKLSVGDGIILDITEDLSQQTNIYTSDFTTGTVSDWIQDISGTTSSLSISGGKITATVSATQSIYNESLITVNPNEVHRITFDYRLTKNSGTPSISPAFSNTSNLSEGVELITLESNTDFQTAQINFIPTNSTIRIGFNLIADGVISLNNIKIDELTDLGQYYDGFQVVKEVIDGDNFVIDLDFIGGIEETTATFSSVNDCGITEIKTRIISEIGNMTQFVFDPYLNYQPIDLFELGTDDGLKRSIEITPDNTIENADETVSLVNVDMTNYRFRLLDGLSLVDLNNKYPWILESEIRNSLIGEDENGIVWYDGVWDCGRWFGGTWYSGTWRDGEWYDGVWNNSLVESRGTIVNIVKPKSSKVQSVWYDGNFRGGTWNGGQWNNGTHKNGLWVEGNWDGGTWQDGTWQDGKFSRGTWISGTWENGTFNCDLGMSNWLDGTWNGGTLNVEDGLMVDLILLTEHLVLEQNLI